MNPFGRDLEQGQRLALALALALGLHLMLLLGFSGKGWSLRFAPPPRFTVALLPPINLAPVPPSPVPIPAEPDDRPATPVTTSVPETAAPPPQPTPSPPPAAASIPAPAAAVKPLPPPAMTRPAPLKTAAPPKPALASKVAKRAPKPPESIRPDPPVNTAPVPTKPPEPSPARTRRLPEKPAQPPWSASPDQPEATRLEAPAKRPERPERPSLPSGSAERPAPLNPPATPGMEPFSGGKSSKRPSGRLDSASLLGQIASLDAETQHQASRAAREQRVSLADSGSLAGFYAADWARKVSRVGEMNFPDAARRQDLSLGPVLEVAIRANGSLREVRVLRSSGNPELDQAARRIVQLAAPYPPFSAALRQQAEVLRITAPWRFDPGGRVRVR